MDLLPRRLRIITADERMAQDKGVKALIAHIRDDAGWSRVQPPLSVVPAQDRTAVSAAYDSLRGRSARERETGAKARAG